MKTPKQDDLDPARGILWGLILSPFGWALVYLIWSVTQ